MPALNFKKRFAPDVESGRKRQTIRKKRKDKRDPRPGQTLYLFTGMRTKSCRRLGEAMCKKSTPISINEDCYITLDGKGLGRAAGAMIAINDGFERESDFFDFFKKEHGLPFYGLLIEW